MQHLWKLSPSTVFDAVYPDSDNEGTGNYIEGTENYNEGTENYNEGTETTPEKFNGLMVNDRDEFELEFSGSSEPDL